MNGNPAQHSAYTVYVDGRKVVDSADSAGVGAIQALQRWAPVALAAAVTALAILLIAKAWDSYEGPAWLAIPLQLVGFPYILGGAALWIHRPGNYLGPVCMLFGAAWYLGDLQAFDQEILFAIGFVGYHLNVVIFAHLALMVPGGRLVGRLDRSVVVALYIMVPVTQFLRYLEVRPVIDRTTFGDVTAYYSSWARVATYLGAPLAVAAAALVIIHFRRATTVQRRSFSLFWVAAAAVGLSAAAAAGLEFWSFELPQQIALLVYSIAMISAAVGLIVGAINVAASNYDAWQSLAGDVTDLERAIAAAAGDPGLRFYFRDNHAWRRGENTFNGELPIGPSAAWTELAVGRQPVAAITHDRELAYQRPLIQAVAAMTLAALARLRLTQERNDAAIDAQHAERSRIGRDLHDGVQTMLASVVRGINGTADQLPADHPERRKLERLAEDAVAVQSRLEQIVHDVYPRGMRDSGLAGAITTLLDSIEPARFGIEVIEDIPDRHPNQRGRERIELEAYFLISEALQNAIKHSGATRVWISVAEVEAVLQITIDDNGRGWPMRGPKRPGNGMANLAARVELLDGILSKGQSVHGGARVQAVLPLPRGEGAETE
ncbi:MAG: sensor histidine kinase [Pseudonocardiaceae bacterium]